MSVFCVELLNAYAFIKIIFLKAKTLTTFTYACRRLTETITVKSIVGIVLPINNSKNKQN